MTSSSFLIIYPNIPNIQLFLNSINQGTYYVYEPETKQDVLSAINTNVTRIGFVWDQYEDTPSIPFFNVGPENISDEFKQLLNELYQKVDGNLTVDLISCNLNTNDFIQQLNNIQITEKSGFTFNIEYSLDLTGIEQEGGDWIMESNNSSIKEIYFTSEIDQWNHVLAANLNSTLENFIDGKELSQQFEDFTDDIEEFLTNNSISLSTYLADDASNYIDTLDNSVYKIRAIINSTRPSGFSGYLNETAVEIYRINAKYLRMPDLIQSSGTIVHFHHSIFKGRKYANDISGGAAKNEIFNGINIQTDLVDNGYFGFTKRFNLNTPNVSRTSGGSVNYGDIDLDTIVGAGNTGSVNINVQRMVFITPRKGDTFGLEYTFSSGRWRLLVPFGNSVKVTVLKQVLNNGSLYDNYFNSSLSGNTVADNLYSSDTYDGTNPRAADGQNTTLTPSVYKYEYMRNGEVFIINGEIIALDQQMVFWNMNSQVPSEARSEFTYTNELATLTNSDDLDMVSFQGSVNDYGFFTPSLPSDFSFSSNDKVRLLQQNAYLKSHMLNGRTITNSELWFTKSEFSTRNASWNSFSSDYIFSPLGYTSSGITKTIDFFERLIRLDRFGIGTFTRDYSDLYVPLENDESINIKTKTGVEFKITKKGVDPDNSYFEEAYIIESVSGGGTLSITAISSDNNTTSNDGYFIEGDTATINGENFTFGPVQCENGFTNNDKTYLLSDTFISNPTFKTVDVTNVRAIYNVSLSSTGEDITSDFPDISSKGLAYIRDTTKYLFAKFSSIKNFKTTVAKTHFNNSLLSKTDLLCVNVSEYDENTPLNVFSDIADPDIAFYCPLENSETIWIKPKIGNKFSVTYNSSTEKYTVGNASGETVSVSELTGTGNLSTKVFDEGDQVTINGEVVEFQNGIATDTSLGNDDSDILDSGISTEDISIIYSFTSINDGASISGFPTQDTPAKRKTALKTIFTNNTTVTNFKASRTELNISSLTKTDLVVLKPNSFTTEEPFNVSENIDASTGYYVPLVLGTNDFIWIQPRTGSKFKITATNDNLYLVQIENSETDTLEIYVDDELTAATTFNDGDSVVINGEPIIFGGVGSDGSEEVQSSSSSGDPHVFPLKGNAFELPNKVANYRMLQANDLIINASTRKVYKEEAREIYDSFKNLIKNVVFDGVFYNEIYLESEKEIFYYNFDNKTTYYNTETNYYTLSNKSIYNNHSSDIEKVSKYKSIFLQWNHSIYGPMEIALIYFENPQQKHGFSLYSKYTSGFKGMLYKECNISKQEIYNLFDNRKMNGNIFNYYKNNQNSKFYVINKHIN